MGVRGHAVNEKTGLLTGIALVKEEDDLMMITDGGMIVRTAASEVPVYGRPTSGVIVMRLAEDAKLVSFDVAAKAEIPGEAASEETTENIVEE